MTGPGRVYLEQGERWVFACAVDWPGWCRRGKGEAAALDALLGYAPRYQAVVGSSFAVVEIQVIGRVQGNATTDFGAPAAVGPWDAAPLSEAELARQLMVLDAAWRSFDAVVAGSPPALRKGPRGGGRDRDQIADHVREAERAYARKIGARIPPRTGWTAQRTAIAGAFRGLRQSGGGWPMQYALRRIAWHVLDHAWEMEDRRSP